ncbi:hypothetical protein WICPIJ_000800 [Wickerhamomyces pijperi]|uniref:Uncharacterized protein n=1 Tax=Wickerhamomyces pijperi TaxID=599730 RepID=A0A9P8QFF4_WICPI|nr:hypothetical protein WICPIJ_000800 [Wickerhamomyces pijperi]
MKSLEYNCLRDWFTFSSIRCSDWISDGSDSSSPASFSRVVSLEFCIFSWCVSRVTLFNVVRTAVTNVNLTESNSSIGVCSMISCKKRSLSSNVKEELPSMSESLHAVKDLKLISMLELSLKSAKNFIIGMQGDLYVESDVKVIFNNSSNNDKVSTSASLETLKDFKEFTAVSYVPWMLKSLMDGKSVELKISKNDLS